MKRFRVYIINFIGFNKTEANATIVLLGIVIFCAIIPRVYIRLTHEPNRTTTRDLELLSEWLVEIDRTLEQEEVPKNQPGKKQIKRFPFDPNSASNTTLKQLGFKPYVASRIIKYREAGGRFNKPSDMHKIFGIDSLLVDQLEPYITIATREEPAKKTYYTSNTKATEFDNSTTKKKVWIDLNLATSEDLQEIHGIGPFYAKNILAYRQKLGGFYAMDQLTEVWKMNPRIMALLREHTFIKSPPKKILPVNSDSLRHLAHHPYLTWNHAKVILSYRKQHGTFTEAEDLMNIKIIDDSLYQKISPYISVEP